VQGAYDAAKKAHRLAQAKGAHDALIQAVYRMKADALEIESGAKRRRLADEYDAAQERGEVATARDGNLGRFSGGRPATAAELGLTRQQVHDARQVRDAEWAKPDLVRRALDRVLDRGNALDLSGALVPTEGVAGRVVAADSVRAIGGSTALRDASPTR
jgi:hypothetical protein